jgi:hypothetical protein
MSCGMRPMNSWGPSAMGTARGGGWMSSIGQLMMLPVTAMMCGLDAMVGGVQCMGGGNIVDPGGDPRLAALRRVFDSSGSLPSGGGAMPASPMAAWSAAPSPVGASPWSTANQATSISSTGDDLGGDELKRVRYRIDFTKPGYETILQPERQELLTYATDAGNFAALKIAEFMEEVARQAVARPQRWIDRKYPKDAVGNFSWRIPADDQRYIDFSYSVDSRRDKQAVDHDREDLRLKEDFFNTIAEFIG